MASRSSQSSRPSGSSSRHREHREHHHRENREHRKQQQYAYAQDPPNETGKLRLWFCHRCNQDNNWDLTSQCINPQCQHRYCDRCGYEEHEVRDYHYQYQQ